MAQVTATTARQELYRGRSDAVLRRAPMAFAAMLAAMVVLVHSTSSASLREQERSRRGWGSWPSPPSSGPGPSGDFDSMMNELDRRLEPANPPQSFVGYSTTSQGSPADENNPNKLLQDLRDARNSSGALISELRDLHNEAAHAEADMARANHLDEAEQRVIVAEREEAARNEKLAENVAQWLKTSQDILVENTNKLAGLEANLTTAAIAMVLLLFLLAVFVVVKSAPPPEKEYIATRFVEAD